MKDQTRSLTCAVVQVQPTFELGFQGSFLLDPKATDRKYLATAGLHKGQATLKRKTHKIGKMEKKQLSKKQTTVQGRK